MAESRRVAMVAACPFPWPRGTPIRIHRFAEALAGRGHELHVVTYHLGQELTDPPFVMHRIDDVPRYTYTAPGPTARKLLQLDPELVRLLRRLHCELRFDVVHAHHYEGLLVAARAVAGAPIVYDAHTMLRGELPYYRVGLPKRLTRWIGGMLDRRLPRRADHVISASDSIRRQLAELGIEPDRISVIANGVEWQRFEAAVGEGPGNRLIFTGNLSAYQGIELMLDAFAVLRTRRPDVELQIVSDSSFRAFERQARRLGIRDAITLRAAPFEELAVLLAAADVAINPRVYCDGVPQKLLNYMASGCPIVSFRGSAAELAHERTALLVPNGETVAMSRAIERLLDDRALAVRLGQAARAEVRRNRSWDRAADRVEAVYERVIAAH